MTEATIRLPKPHPAQADALRRVRRFNLWNCGRRWGKDVVCTRRMVKAVIKDPGPYAWFAPTYRMLLDNWRDTRNTLAPVIARANDSEHRLELVNGSILDMWSLDSYDAARGRKYKHVYVNEAASAKNLREAWTAVIRPTLADYQGGADFPSTPKGLNFFFELWQAAEDRPDWARFHYTTFDNPYIAREEIDEMERTLPARTYRQEIMAEFIEDGAFFQKVDEAAVVAEPDKPEQHAGHTIVAGLDWALSEDFTVLTIVCRDCKKTVDWWRANKMDFTYQRLEIIDRCKRWGATVLPERNSIGEPNIEMLIQAGIDVATGPDNRPGFNTTSTTKAELIQRLAAGLEHDGLMVPVEYGDELRSYEVEFTSGGNAKFSAPSGLHDDRVISLALAWWLAGTPQWWFV